MKLIFCGTPEFAVGTLEAVVAAGHSVALVVCQPDRASGRGLATTAGAVKEAAIRLGLPITQPDKIKRNEEFRSQLEAIAPDAILVVAYGRIIPDWMLALPRFGCINLHGSLLPKYRGAAPIQWAVANGEPLTGVTTMLLNAGLDTGPMLLTQVEPIAPEQSAEDLFKSLAKMGAKLMLHTLTGLQDGSVVPIEQNHSAATLAPILTREDGRIDFARGAQSCLDRWRGFQPWPGAWTRLRGKKLIVHRMALAADPLAMGELRVASNRLYAGCGEASLELLELQLEGKKRLAAGDFLRGFQIRSGERLGEESA